MSGNNGCQNDENDYEIGLRDGRLAALEEAALLAEADGVESVAARIRDLKLPRRPRVENKRACNPNLDSALMYARKEVREWAARDDMLTTDERAMKARASAHSAETGVKEAARVYSVRRYRKYRCEVSCWHSRSGGVSRLS